MKEITEKTLLPISLVMTLIGGIVWLTSVYAEVQAHSSRLSTLEERQEKTVEMLRDIKEDVAVIRVTVIKKEK